MFDRTAAVGRFPDAVGRGSPLRGRWLLAAIVVASAIQAPEAFGQTSRATGPRAQLSTDEFDVGRLGFGRFKASTSLEVGDAGTGVLEVRKSRNRPVSV